MKRTFILFSAQETVFAVNISKVVSIERNGETTSIPQSPDYMVGVVNIRGRIIPVIDSDYILFQNRLKVNEESRLILLEVRGSIIALLVEQTNEILDIEENLINSVEMMKENYFVEGIALKDSRIISILDSEKLIDFIDGFEESHKELINNVG